MMENNQNNELTYLPNLFYIDTGNLLCSETLKRKAILLPSEEFLEGLRLALAHWNSDTDCSEKIVPGDRLNYVNQQNGDAKLPLIYNPHIICQGHPLERDSCKVSIKVFVYDLHDDPLNDAIQYMLKKFSIESIDALIVSLQNESYEDKSTTDRMTRCWMTAEDLVGRSLVKEIGMADLETNQLIHLYDNVAEKVKPATNQINLATCCVVPEDMKRFAKSKNIRLLTHSDYRDFMSKESFVSILKECGIKDVDAWRRYWIARYVIIQKGSNIVHNKGYVLGICSAK